MESHGVVTLRHVTHERHTLSSEAACRVTHWLEIWSLYDKQTNAT